MSQEFNELNERQCQAVFTNKSKVLVMAGAGAGKTKVLTNRIAYLLSQGVLETEIVAFTFTNKAANEMKLRLNKILGRQTKAFIGTFHSFCYNGICDMGNYTKLGFKDRPQIISDYEKGKVINDIVKQYNEKLTDTPFINAISKIKNGVKIGEIKMNDLTLLNYIYKEYQQKLIDSNMLDFDDMVPLYLKLLDIDEEYYEHCSQFRYVLVDECQDTNKIQYDLIKKVSDEYKNIFMVGDEDQLIYSFRSSDIAILKDFELSANEVIILNENYRCSKQILYAANNLIEKNGGRLNKDLVSHINSSNQVAVLEYLSQDDEAKDVVNRIKQIHMLGDPYESIAVLYRNNALAYPIEKILTEEKIPYTIYGGKAFFEYTEIRTILYIYRFISNPRNEIAFEAIYNKPRSKFEWYEIKEFLEEYHKQKEDIITFLTLQKDSKFVKLGNVYSSLSKSMKELKSLDFFNEVLECLNYSKYMEETNNQKPEYKRLMILKDMIKQLEVVEVNELFNNILLENKDTVKQNGVSLMTIHRSKGLEFKNVIVICCNDGIISGGLNNKIEEERRLFYVAMTRAKEKLILTCSKLHFINGVRYKLKPSEFIYDAKLRDKEVEEFFGDYWYNK